MTFQFRLFLSACLLLLVIIGGFRSQPAESYAAVTAAADDAAKPVESDMHEFMEYIFQPTYRRLKPAMAAAPTENAVWKSIKSDALILAEGGNLLLDRQPEDDSADWVNHSIRVREFGGQLYRAAKAKDYAAARTNYEAMTQHCNACHHQFAGGEHILTP